VYRYRTRAGTNFSKQTFWLKTRGAPISKLTDIPITDISAIKSTDSDTDIITPMDSSLLLLQMLQIYFSLLSVIPNCIFNTWHSWIVLLNRDNTCVQKYRLSSTNFVDINITDMAILALIPILILI